MLGMNSAMHALQLPNVRLAEIAKENLLQLYIMDVAVARPRLVVCRFAAPLYYANAESFMDEVLSWISGTSALGWFVLRFDSIESVDYVGAKMLMELADRMRNQNITLVFTELATELSNFLSDSGVLTTIGLDKVFASVDAAIAAYNLSEQEAATFHV
jgi:MFS superfamily sulfate permease-like transporter